MIATTEGARAFDFLHGTWNVANRKLVRRLAGSSDWDEFPGTALCRGFFDGAANIDQIDFPTLGFTGMTLRLFDPARELWSLYWANSRDGLLQPPVIGRLANGRGDFYGDDTDDGQPIRVHYLWSEITPQSARWQQAFSLDGESWETNWIMQFTRAA
jgi:hypothetical protein